MEDDRERAAMTTSSAERQPVHADLVATTRTRLPPAVEITTIAELFRLLGDPTRVRILYALLESGELCVSDLAEATDSVESTVSHALRLLRAAGVVANRRDGRVVYYRLDDAHVRMLLDLTREHVEHGAADG